MVSKDQAKVSPQNWVSTKLGEIVNIVYGKNLPLSNLSSTGYPVFGANGIIGYYDKFLYKDEQLLISCRGAYSGKINYSPAQCFITNNSLVLEVDKQYDHLKKYLFYALQIADKSKLVTGTAQPQVTINNAVEVLVSLCPIGEQKRIVAKIEELFTKLDAGVEALKKVKAEIKRYRQAVLKAAFEGKLTAEWRKKNKNKLEPASKLLERIARERDKTTKGKAKPLPALDTSNLPDLPNGWEWVRLGEIIEEPKYGTSKKCNYENQGFGVLRIPNITKGIVDGTDLKYAKFDNKERETYRLIKGDLLTIRSNGSVSIVGKCAMVSEADERFLFAGYLIRIRPFKTAIISKYLLYGMDTYFLRNQIESKSKSTSGVNNINSNEIKSLVVPLCKINEQEQIIAEIERHFSVADEVEQTIERSLKEADRLRQSILKKAFEGKLVPQDPTDEPAEKLLDRIQQNRNKLNLTRGNRNA